MENNSNEIKVFSPLPVFFIVIILFIAILNIDNLISSYKASINENSNNLQVALSSIEGKYSNSFHSKTNYIDLNGLFSLLIDKKEVNERFKLNNGYLTNSLFYTSSTFENISNVTNLSNYLEFYDIPYIYIQTPHLLQTDDDIMIPSGYFTSINQYSDDLLDALALNNIDFLDLRQNILEQNINNYDLFFKTDSHWTTEASFWAHTQIIEFLDDKFDYFSTNSLYSDINNYTSNVMNSIILGSHGQRTGVYYGGTDTVTAIIPNFETNFHLQIPSENIDTIGSFSNSLMNLENYTDTKITSSPENIYFGSNTEYKKITNLLSENDLKVLVINDSFSLPLVPFLSLYFSEVHMYDFRSYYNGSPDGFVSYLHEINPDIVLHIRNLEDIYLTEEILSTIEN